MPRVNKLPAQSQKLYTGKGSRRNPALAAFGSRETGVYFPTLNTVTIAAGAVDVLAFTPTGLTAGARLTLPASVSAAESLVLPHGTSPSSPTNGGLWTTTAALFARINGVTHQYPNNFVSGTFTPTVAGTTVAGAASSYSTRQGVYMRIGDDVFFSIALAWSGHTGTGSIIVTGLPVASASSPAATALAIADIGSNQLSATAGTITRASIAASSTTIQFTSIFTDGTTSSQPTSIRATFSTLLVSGHYRV